MHSFHRTAAILKLTDKVRALQGAYTEWELEFQRSHFKQYHNSQWKTQSTQDAWNKKEKLVKANWFFFTVEKKSDGNLVEEVQSTKTIPNLPKSINSKNRKSEEDFDYENDAAIWGLTKTGE